MDNIWLISSKIESLNNNNNNIKVGVVVRTVGFVHNLMIFIDIEIKNKTLN